MGLDPALLHLASQQFGVLSRHQLHARGVSVHQLHRALESGMLQRVYSGAFRIGGSPSTWEQMLKAAELSAGPEAGVSHRAAASLWEIQSCNPRPVEIATHRKLRPRDFTVFRTFCLGPNELVQHLGFTVTDPVRTLLDLGKLQSPQKLERALENALRTELVTWDGFESRFQEWRRSGRNGVSRWEVVLSARAAELQVTESEFETLLSQIIERHGLPAPKRQVSIMDGDLFVKRPDFVYERAKVALEADSLTWHFGRDAWHRDLETNNRLSAMGWLVLRFTWDDVTRRPGWVAATIRNVLSVRAA